VELYYLPTAQKVNVILRQALSPSSKTPSWWDERVLYRFEGRLHHGAYAENPLTNVVIGDRGVLYGTYGTTGGIATAFSLTPPFIAGDLGPKGF
jgi:hypothetical protein